MNILVTNRFDEELSSLQIDVIKKLNGEFTVNELVSMFGSMFYEKLIIDVTSIKDYENVTNLQGLSMHFDCDKLILFIKGINQNSEKQYISKLISMGIYNFTRNVDGIITLLSKVNTYKDVATLHVLDEKAPSMVQNVNGKTRVIGIKSVTSSAGCTSLIYMMKKQLEDKCRVCAIEVDKNDFRYYNEKNMFSFSSTDLGNELVKLSNNYNVILIDLNYSNQLKVCNEVLYLLEPSIIKLNKLVRDNNELLNYIRNKKIILNKSLLSSKDIQELQMESGIRLFYVLPPLNDRVKNTAIDGLLFRLGLIKENTENNSERVDNKKIFNIFRRKS